MDQPSAERFAGSSGAGASTRSPRPTDEALEAYRQAELYRFGISLRETGGLDDSAAALRQSIAVEPNAPEPYLEVAQALDRLGKPDEARAERARAQQSRDSSYP